MARRRRPAGGRGMASARVVANPPGPSGPSGEPGEARDAAAAETAARQLPLPLPPDPQPHAALPPVEVTSRPRARTLPPAPSAAPSASQRATAQRAQSQTHSEVPHGDAAEQEPLHVQPRPSRPSGPREGRPMHAHLDDVRSALADGWEIVQPIFARPLWSVSDDSATAFNFVLRRERATRLVTVPEGRGVQRFIRDHHLAVDYRA